MKFHVLLGLALLNVCLIGAVHSVPVPPQVDHPSISPKVYQRLKTAAISESLPPWQHKTMMGLADEVGSARMWHTASSGLDGIWTQEPSEPSPSPRVEPTVIYDPVRDRLVVFGGADTTYLGDVWALSLSGNPSWTKLPTTGTPPSARYAHTGIYDPVHDRMIIFGGAGDAGSLSDVWALSLAGNPAWTELTPTGTSPGPLVEHTAIYDPVRDRMVVFGGAGPSGYVNDVWALSLAGTPAWVQLTPTGLSPSGRYAHSAVYDPVRDRMLIFGGYYFDDDGDHNLNDVWALSLAGAAAWTQLAPGGALPSGRVSHRAIYDPVRDRMIIFGGRVFNFDFNNEVWELSLTGSLVWSLLTPSQALPSPRSGHSAIYDPVRDRMLVFAGIGDPGIVNDTWELSLTEDMAWSRLAAGLVPSGRYVHTAVYDAPRDRMVMFGGVDGDWVNDTWALRLSGLPVWTLLTPGGTPPAARGAHTAIYDPVRDRMIVFGGAGPSGYLDDVWVLSLTSNPVWTQLAPEGVLPSARNWHSAIYDPVRDRMVLFGGTFYDDVTERYFNDVWALPLSGNPTWTRLVPTGTPPDGRSEHTAIYDPVRDRMIVFGGFSYDGNNHLYGDVWALSFSGGPAWTEIIPAGTPPSARAAQTAIYDPVRDQMVVFGGYDGNFLSDTWALSLSVNSAWTQLAPTGGVPSARVRNTAIFDPMRDRMMMFGGYDYEYLGDLWSLRWGTSTGVPSQTEETVLRLAPAFPNPARSDVSIRFTLPRSSEATLRIYDVSGRLVRSLAEGTLPAGPQLLRWDRRLASGVLAPSGLYFYELRVNREKLARRVVLMR